MRRADSEAWLFSQVSPRSGTRCGSSISAGALVSALLWTSDGRDTLKWLRLTLFGASSAFVLGLLAELRQGPPIDPVFCTLFTLFGAVFLPLVRWLSLKGL